MDEIEELIEQERFVEAQELLNGVKKKERNARWHFLQGKIYLNRKWYLEARKQFRLAVLNADPENEAEYKALLDDLEEFSKTPEYKEYKNKRFAEDCVDCCAAGCAGC